MIIRRMKKSDIAAAARISGKNYSKAYGRRAEREMRAMINHKVVPHKYFVADENGIIVGSGGYSQSWIDYHIYNIFWIDVDPEYQRKGIGTRIVRRIISEIRKHKGEDKASLILLSTSKPRFYSKRFGFRTLTKFKKREHDLMGLRVD